jgi:hypothetical protein
MKFLHRFLHTFSKTRTVVYLLPISLKYQAISHIAAFRQINIVGIYLQFGCSNEGYLLAFAYLLRRRKEQKTTHILTRMKNC